MDYIGLMTSKRKRIQSQVNFMLFLDYVFKQLASFR